MTITLRELPQFKKVARVPPITGQLIETTPPIRWGARVRKWGGGGKRARSSAAGVAVAVGPRPQNLFATRGPVRKFFAVAGQADRNAETRTAKRSEEQEHTAREAEEMCKTRLTSWPTITRPGTTTSISRVELALT